MSTTLPPHLRELLAVMERDMGVPSDALLAQAVFTLARLHGYVVPSELPESAAAVATRAARDAAGDGSSERTVEDELTPSPRAPEALAPAGAPSADAPDLEDDERGHADPELPTESTIVRRSNQAVRIRAIADDVARLTIPFEPSRARNEVAESGEDDEWLDEGEDAADISWAGDAYDDEGGFYAEEEPFSPVPAPEPPELPESVGEGERLALRDAAVGGSSGRTGDSERVAAEAGAGVGGSSGRTGDSERVAAEAGAGVGGSSGRMRGDPSSEPADEAPDPFDLAAESGVSWDDLDELAPATPEPARVAAASGSSGPAVGGASGASEPVSVEAEVEEPAWVETSTPEASLGPHPVISDPTEVDETREIGPLLGSKRGSEGDYDKLLADLEDLESGVSVPSDDDIGAATDVVEARSLLTLTVEGTDRSVEVGTTPFVIGRTRDCDLQIVSERVSRQHAVIESAGPLDYRIVDRNSSNGLWLGRERIREHTLRDGDVLRVGDKKVKATIRLFTER